VKMHTNLVGSLSMDCPAAAENINPLDIMDVVDL
jgi:hypothetical protein